MPVAVQSLGDVLIQEVLEHPEDDVPRLIYADWLAENDQPVRAEFIQLQCRLAKEQPDYALDTGTSPRAYTSSGDPRIRRAYALFQELAFPTVSKGPITLTSFQWTAATWRRGFVEGLSLSCSEFTRLARLVFKLHPVTRVQLKDRQPTWCPGWNGYWSWRVTGDEVPFFSDGFLLPHEIFNLLGPGHRESQHGQWRHFDSKERAVQELSQACVAFGITKRKEGLSEALSAESEKDTS
ncbi:MAG: TIGR02996 domain-containing protein [Alphaproteobacteria bacterium]|nr:MAG: TIGR02996 domain-containing protein [Alphaproteobacteria bacterium]